MKDKIGDKQRLLHILDAVFEIEAYAANVDMEAFFKNSMMRFASIKQIEITGEAASFISQETKNRFSEIEWRQIIGMRHILVHETASLTLSLILIDPIGTECKVFYKLR